MLASPCAEHLRGYTFPLQGKEARELSDRREGGWLFVFGVLTLVLLGTAWLYVGWKSAQMVLPRGVYAGQLSLSGMTREQALKTLADAYAQPLDVYYVDQRLLLVPEMVELSLDVEQTSAQLDAIIRPQGGWRGFLNYALDTILGHEPPRREIHPVVNYSRERIDAFLERVARQYDHPPLPPVPLPEAGTYRPPEDGTTLDIDASRPLLVRALLDPTQTELHLVVLIEPAPPAPMSILGEALQARLADFNGVAGIFVKDLETGRELCLNCDVAFAGLSTLKIAIVTDLYRHLDGPPDPQTTRYISATLTESDNGATNAILAQIGAGNPFSGAQEVTDFLWSLGLENTFLAIPYNMREGREPPQIVTPANSRTDLDTQPDPFIQTTPLDIGLLLSGLEMCRNNGGMLRLLYPHQLTPDECGDILGWLERNEINTLLEAGMPEGTRIAHKHGWAGETHADVALVYSPGARFVLSTFLYRPDWLVWSDSAPTFADIGRLTYRFFNPEEPTVEESPSPDAGTPVTTTEAP